MDNTTTQGAETMAPKSAVAPTPAKSKRAGVTVAGFVLGLIAWALMVLSWQCSLAAAVVGCLLSAIGCYQPRSNMRNLAITGVIVSAVLLLIYILIYAGISMI